MSFLPHGVDSFPITASPRSLSEQLHDTVAIVTARSFNTASLLCVYNLRLIIYTHNPLAVLSE